MRPQWLIGATTTGLLACGLSVVGTLDPKDDALSALDASRETSAGDDAGAAADGSTFEIPDEPDAGTPTDAGPDAIACGAEGTLCSNQSCCTTLFCGRKQQSAQSDPYRCTACRPNGSGCGPNGPSIECCGRKCSSYKCSN